MFSRSNIVQPSLNDEINFSWNGQAMKAEAGDTVAAALLSNSVRSSRMHPVTGEPRAPFCMMGICFECLVEIDGLPNQQACQVLIEEGMVVKSQRGARS